MEKDDLKLQSYDYMEFEYKQSGFFLMRSLRYYSIGTVIMRSKYRS